MAVQYHSVSTPVTVTLQTTITITKPSGVVAGDLLIASISTEHGQGETSAPDSSWHLLQRTKSGTGANTEIMLETWWKLAGSSEPDDYTFTFLISGNPNQRDAAGAILRLSGQHATPVSDFDTNATTGSLSSIDVGPVATSADGGMFLAIGAARMTLARTTDVTDWAERADFNGGNFSAGIAIYTLAVPTAGSSGTVTITWSGTTPNQAAHLFAIEPDSGEIHVSGEAGVELGFDGAVVPGPLLSGAWGVTLGFEGAISLADAGVTVGGAFGVEASLAGQVLAGKFISGELGVAVGLVGSVKGDIEIPAGAWGIELGFTGAVLPQAIELSGGELGILVGFDGALSTGRLLAGVFGLELAFRDRYTGPGSGVQVGVRPTDPLGKLRARQQALNRMREGDWMPLMLPWIELDDVVGRGLVLARTASDAREEQQIQWQIVRDSDPGVTAALRTGEALRHRPAERDDMAREVVRQRAERERIRRR